MGIIALAIAMTSCEEPAMYDEFVPISDAGWSADSSVTFDVVVNDTTSRYAVYVRIRHNADFPYQNLYMFRSIRNGNEQIYEDKINYRVAEPNGKWLGDGFGALKTIDAPYSRNSLKFTKRGTYQFRFTQGMRDSVLQGVEEVGLRIVPLNNSDNG